MTNYADETNPLVGGAAYHAEDRETLSFDEFVSLGGTLTRVRLLTERGYPVMDVSYIYGELPGGRKVRLQSFPFHYLGRRTYRSEIADAVRAAGGSSAQVRNAWDSEVYSVVR